MTFKKGALARLVLLASLVLSLAICVSAPTAHAADNGLITKPSKYSVKETVTRFEAAVKDKEAAGFTVFTEIDHAAAAKKFGLDMRPRTVIVFGNPKLGTPAMVNTPLLAIDVPPKALVWEDDQGKVWLSYNSSDYLYNTIYPRHGAAVPPATAPFAKTLGRDERSGDEIGQSGRSQPEWGSSQAIPVQHPTARRRDTKRAHDRSQCTDKNYRLSFQAAPLIMLGMPCPKMPEALG